MLALVQAGERVLSGTFGGPVRLGEAESLCDKYRNRVLHCAVADGPAGTPASVIVKALVKGCPEAAQDALFHHAMSYARADRFGHLPALSETCRALAARLRALWPEGDTAMPPYPPFDGGARPAPVSFG